MLTKKKKISQPRCGLGAALKVFEIVSFMSWKDNHIRKFPPIEFNGVKQGLGKNFNFGDYISLHLHPRAFEVYTRGTDNRMYFVAIYLAGRQI